MSSEHETQFVGGVVRCTCGWKSTRLCWSIREVDEEAARHLELVASPKEGEPDAR